MENTVFGAILTVVGWIAVYFIALIVIVFVLAGIWVAILWVCEKLFGIRIVSKRQAAMEAALEEQMISTQLPFLSERLSEDSTITDFINNSPGWKIGAPEEACSEDALRIERTVMGLPFTPYFLTYRGRRPNYQQLLRLKAALTAKDSPVYLAKQAGMRYDDYMLSKEIDLRQSFEDYERGDIEKILCKTVTGMYWKNKIETWVRECEPFDKVLLSIEDEAEDYVNLVKAFYETHNIFMDEIACLEYRAKKLSLDEITSLLHDLPQGDDLKTGIDRWVETEESPETIERWIADYGYSLLGLGRAYYYVKVNGPLNEEVDYVNTAEHAKRTRVVRNKEDFIDIYTSMERGVTQREMAAAFLMEYANVKGAPLKVAKNILASVKRINAETLERGEDLDAHCQRAVPYWEKVIEILRR